MKYLAVINPVSGNKDKADFLAYFKDQCHHYGITASVFNTTGDADLRKLKNEIESFEPDRVIAAGGDGTFALVALATMHSQTEVGVIPLGSANGMAKELNVRQGFKLAFDDILKSELIKPMDIVRINGKYHCIHLADVGINARVVKAFDSDGSRGMLTYGKHLATELNKSEEFNYKIEANGKIYAGSCVMLAVANGRKFGTGVPVTESGNPFDGRFELAIVKVVSIETLIKAGLSAIEGLMMAENVDEVIQASEAKVTFDKPQLLQSDGEVIGEFEKLEISMLKGGFRFITHADNPYLAKNRNKTLKE